MTGQRPCANLSSTPPLEFGAIHVWRISLDRPAPNSLSDVLDSTERERAGRFFRERDRARYVRRHAALRCLAAHYLDVAPELVQFDASPQGKPRLWGNCALRLNASHSGDMALCAFALDDEIGVDVEQIRTEFDWRPLARRFFSTAEYVALLALASDQQSDGFFSVWTQKEAFVKALGDGLRLPLDSFVSPFVSGNPRVRDVFVQPVELGTDWRAALAMVGKSFAWRVLAWPDDNESLPVSAS